MYLTKSALFFFLSCISFSINAQIKFEKGYFITPGGQRVECLIKNIDWDNNPSQFEYKLDVTASVLSAGFEEAKEFGVYNFSKYRLFKVSIDRSSKNLNELSTVRNSEFKEETLFLKVLQQGKASLYEYKSGDLKRFFYSTDSVAVTQLIFKVYLNEESKYAENRDYIIQLWKDVRCTNETPENVELIKYNRESLLDFFTKYNKCKNFAFENFSTKHSKININLYARPGIQLADVKSFNPVYGTIDFGRKATMRLGFELEVIFPFNKNKWSFILEPAYQQFNSAATDNFGNNQADYKSIELSLGFRHYFFLSNRQKIFLNALLINDVSLGATFKYKSTGTAKQINKFTNVPALGGGVNINNRITAEYRYQFTRKLQQDKSLWYSEYQSMAIIIGYNFLKKKR